MDNIPKISAFTVIPAFLYGMAASCGMIVAIKFQSVGLQSPEIFLMSAAFVSGLISDRVLKIFSSRSNNDIKK